MRNFILAFFMMCSLSLAAPTKKPVATPKPVTVEQVVKSGGTVRNAQQDAELKHWIIGIQKLAQDAQKDADNAEKEAATTRQHLAATSAALNDANMKATELQGAINVQTSQLNQSITENGKLKAKVEEQSRHVNNLKTLVGLIAAAGAVLGLLWLKVPAIPAWGLPITIGAPVFVFGLIKLLL